MKGYIYNSLASPRLPVLKVHTVPECFNQNAAWLTTSSAWTVNVRVYLLLISTTTVAKTTSSSYSESRNVVLCYPILQRRILYWLAPRRNDNYSSIVRSKRYQLPVCSRRQTKEALPSHQWSHTFSKDIFEDTAPTILKTLLSTQSPPSDPARTSI